MEVRARARRREAVRDMSINRVNISGNLTRDPELRSTGAGRQVLSFGVAVNDRRRDPNTGEWGDYPNYVDCVVFGARAESLSRFLFKGTKVAIEGKLRYSSWEGKDGQRRSKLEVIVDEIEFLSSRNQGQGGYQQSNNYQQGNQAQSYQQGGQGGYQQDNQSYGGPSFSSPASSGQQPYSGSVQAPPPADVYDEDIPF